MNNRNVYKAKNNKIGMGEILLLEEVFNEVVSNKEEYTLFGRRDYKIRDKVFDFLLHYVKNSALKCGACYGVFEHAQKSPDCSGLKPRVCSWRFLTYQRNSN